MCPLFMKFTGLEMAPELEGITHWFNTKPISLKGLRGKVVLVDFWTYTCVNCIRTLPHIREWDEKYKGKGLVIIGVHTPEFDFEKKFENVGKAVKDFDIKYPVALDSSYRTWNAYGNRYWPAKYLIDAKGNIRTTHFGEGGYDEMEEAIRVLLKEAGQKIEEPASVLEDTTPKMSITPETYLGMARMDRFASKEKPKVGVQTFTLPGELPQHHFAYGGKWGLQMEHASSFKGSVMEMDFYAGKVFLVMHPKGKCDEVKVSIDDKPLDESSRGKDVKDSVIEIDEPRMYHVIDLKGKAGEHMLRLELQNGGTSVYAFTFG